MGWRGRTGNRTGAPSALVATHVASPAVAEACVAGVARELEETLCVADARVVGARLRHLGGRHVPQVTGHVHHHNVPAKKHCDVADLVPVVVDQAAQKLGHEVVAPGLKVADDPQPLHVVQAAATQHMRGQKAHACAEQVTSIAGKTAQARLSAYVGGIRTVPGAQIHGGVGVGTGVTRERLALAVNKSHEDAAVHLKRVAQSAVVLVSRQTARLQTSKQSSPNKQMQHKTHAPL